MKKRISIFFIALSTMMMLGHNLIPHCHHEANDGNRSQHTCSGHSHHEIHQDEGFLGEVFSVVPHNHAGMSFFEHVQIDIPSEKKSLDKSIVAEPGKTPVVIAWVADLVVWPPPAPIQLSNSATKIQGLRAPPFLG